MKQVARIIACATLLVHVACSNSNDSGSGASLIPQVYAVGTTSRTYIDTSRPTAAQGSVPATSSRTLKTIIVYPAAGTPEDAVKPDAPLDTSAAPFPLVVLSHGLGGNVESLLPLAEAWASRGYVVALPLFPLTNSASPGPTGAGAGDVQNQPADVSFVIDQILAESDASGLLLSDSVDGDMIAASGHSNGGITTYGLVAHSCCRDARIDAAIVLSSVNAPFTGGEYDLSDTPPMLLVHGVNDDLIVYNLGVRTYNQLLPPKGLLALEASDHFSYLLPGDPAFDVLVQATADFLDGELRDDGAALDRLPGHQIPGIATMHWAPDDASNVPVETLPEPETNRQAFLSADSNLTDGQVITVTWTGFLAGNPKKGVNVLQCTGNLDSSAATCDIGRGWIFYPDPEGMGSVELVIHTGPIGNGVCDSANPCLVIVNDAGLGDEEAIIRIPITFAP